MDRMPGRDRRRARSPRSGGRSSPSGGDARFEPPDASLAGALASALGPLRWWPDVDSAVGQQHVQLGGARIVALLPFILIAVAMYFLLIRPQRRRMAEQRRRWSARCEEGDEVMTTAGIYGFVTAIDGDVVWLEIADGVEIRVARQAVARRIPAEEAPSTGRADRRRRRRGRRRRRHGRRRPSADGTKDERDAPTAD